MWHELIKASVDLFLNERVLVHYFLLRKAEIKKSDAFHPDQQIAITVHSLIFPFPCSSLNVFPVQYPRKLQALMSTAGFLVYIYMSS